MTTILLVCLAGFAGYLLGKLRAYREVVEINNFVDEQEVSWADLQREASKWQ